MDDPDHHRRRRRGPLPPRALPALLVAGLPLLAGEAGAQVLPPTRGLDPGPGEFRPPLPEPRPAPEPGFALPPLPEPPARDLSEGVAVFVDAIRLEGNTVFDDEALAEVTAPYVGREVTTEELLAVRDALTGHYVDRGYINSGAVIPDQTVDDGVITIRIVEGTLDEIRVSGLQSLAPSFVEDRLRLGAGPPLDVENLRERIQLLLTDPAVERVDARLGPGRRPGEGRLDIEVVEAPRYRHAVRFANDRAPSVGAERAELTFSFGNILGHSDPLRLQVGVSEGLRDGEVAYSVPLTARDLRVFAVGQVIDSNVVEEPFNEIDVESESRSLQLGLSWPVIRTLDDELRLDLAFERKRSTTFLLGEPFPFSPGVEADGESNVTALRFAQQWQRRAQDQVLALRSTLSLGLDALGATTNPGDLPDGRFFAWLGQVQFARRLNDAGWQIGLRGDLQLTPDPLLPIERIAIGGVDTVRGYRENELVRDNGWDASVELRIPLPRLRIPAIATRPDDGELSLVPFVDAGGGWNVETDTTGPDVIWSVGAGLRWQPDARTSLRLDFGVPLESVPDPDDHNLQDLGLHVEVRRLLY